MPKQSEPAQPQLTRRSRNRGTTALLAGCVVVAAAVAIALDQYAATQKRRQFVAPPADPALLQAPTIEGWRASPIQPGTPAPGFELADVRTRARVSLDAFRGRPVVLLLSSFGCNVFCNELDELIDLHEEYEDEAAFLFIAIRDAGHPDPRTAPPPGKPLPGESAEQTRRRLVREGAEFLRLPFPTLLDANGEAEKAYDAFPKRLVIVGADGRVAYDGGRGASGGPSAWDLPEVERHLRAALGQLRIAD